MLYEDTLKELEILVWVKRTYGGVGEGMVTAIFKTLRDYLTQKELDSLYGSEG